jgi:hypothetical protein
VVYVINYVMCTLKSVGCQLACLDGVWGRSAHLKLRVAGVWLFQHSKLLLETKDGCMVGAWLLPGTLIKWAAQVAPSGGCMAGCRLVHSLTDTKLVGPAAVLEALQQVVACPSRRFVA